MQKNENGDILGIPHALVKETRLATFSEAKVIFFFQLYDLFPPLVAPHSNTWHRPKVVANQLPLKRVIYFNLAWLFEDIMSPSGNLKTYELLDFKYFKSLLWYKIYHGHLASALRKVVNLAGCSFNNPSSMAKFSQSFSPWDLKYLKFVWVGFS